MSRLHSPESSRPDRRPRARVALVGVLVLALAACGSNLDPEQVAQTNGEASGTAAGTDASVDGSIDFSGTGTGTDAGTGSTTTDGGTDTTTGGGTGTTGGGTDTTGGGTGTTGGGGEDGGDGGGQPPAVDPDSSGSCAGFKNGPGVTDDTITIGNASDIGGPVPGLFATAQDATQAFVAYFNASVPEGICGRKLALKTYDSRADASADQQNYAAACKDVFAMVGSQSAFDNGGAAAAEGCGLPDIRASAVTAPRSDCSTCFGSQSVNNDFFEKAVPDFVKKKFPGSVDKAAMLYTNAGAAAENGIKQVKAMERAGLEFPVVQPIDIAEFNYSSIVQKLQQEGIEVVFFITEWSYSLKMRQAMQQQGYKPKLYLRDPTDYNPRYVEGGAAVDGTVVYTNYVPYEEKNAESDLYESWLNQVKPGTPPLFMGTFAWSAARLFVELANKLGGKLSRETLVAELRKVDDWTANGMHAPQPVGSKGTGDCWRFIQLSGGTWKPVDGTKFTCAGLVSAQ